MAVLPENTQAAPASPSKNLGDGKEMSLSASPSGKPEEGRKDNVRPKEAVESGGAKTESDYALGASLAAKEKGKDQFNNVTEIRPGSSLDSSGAGDPLPGFTKPKVCSSKSGKHQAKAAGKPERRRSRGRKAGH